MKGKMALLEENICEKRHALLGMLVLLGEMPA